MTDNLKALMAESEINNSFDIRSVTDTLKMTLENSFSYLYRLQRNVIRFKEYFYPHSQSSGKYPEIPYGDLFLDDKMNVCLKIDADLVKQTARETFRTSSFYNTEFTLEDIENMEFSSEDEHDFLVFNEYSHILSSEKIELLKDYYYTGKTIEDIAEEKGKTTGAVKMQLKRIREKIKNFLKETDNEKESGFN